jgi:hypothetical protein
MTGPLMARRHLVLTHATNGAYTMVHRGTCHMAKRGNAKPWEWADHAPLEMVRRAVVRGDYRTCRTCWPLAYRYPTDPQR